MSQIKYLITWINHSVQCSPQSQKSVQRKCHISLKLGEIASFRLRSSDRGSLIFIRDCKTVLWNSENGGTWRISTTFDQKTSGAFYQAGTLSSRESREFSRRRNSLNCSENAEDWPRNTGLFDWPDDALMPNQEVAWQWVDGLELWPTGKLRDQSYAREWVTSFVDYCFSWYQTEKLPWLTVRRFPNEASLCEIYMLSVVFSQPQKAIYAKVRLYLDIFL